MPDHDALYHRLFSHPGMVAQLLREFVAEPWLNDLDLDSMQRVNARFHARKGERRDGDVIWRIPARDGGSLRTGADAYLLLLLEFQSTQDRWMALRVMIYAGLLWQQIVKEKRLTPDGRLPPIFPVVVYNGDRSWAMPIDLSGLVGLPDGSPLWRWQPNIRYHILDEGAFGDADLTRRDTLAALLFRLENSRDPAQIVATVDAVIDWFRRHDGFDALKPLFAALTGRVVEMAEGANPGVRVSENLLEVRTMLATRAAEWKQQWGKEAREKGLQEGLEEGRRAAGVGILTRLLEHRFGALPDAAKDRIAKADTSVLEEWSLRVLDADRIDDVLR
jgi:hypothetical protein